MPSGASSILPAEDAGPGAVVGEDGSLPIKKLHVLPIGEPNLGSLSIVEFLTPTLRQLRIEREAIFSGRVLKVQGQDFVVVKADRARACW